MSHVVKMALHDVPDPEALARLMQRTAFELTADFPAILRLRMTAEKIAVLEGHRQEFQVHLELLFPQLQIIVNGAEFTPEAALRDALAAARPQLERLAARGTAVAPARETIVGAAQLPRAA